MISGAAIIKWKNNVAQSLEGVIDAVCYAA
jgi:hypothetical protein